MRAGQLGAAAGSRTPILAIQCPGAGETVEVRVSALGTALVAAPCNARSRRPAQGGQQGNVIGELHPSSPEHNIALEPLRVGRGLKPVREQMIHVSRGHADQAVRHVGGTQIEVTTEDERCLPCPPERMSREALDLQLSEARSRAGRAMA